MPLNLSTVPADPSLLSVLFPSATPTLNAASLPAVATGGDPTDFSQLLPDLSPPDATAGDPAPTVVGGTVPLGVSPMPCGIMTGDAGAARAARDFDVPGDAPLSPGNTEGSEKLTGTIRPRNERATRRGTDASERPAKEEPAAKSDLVDLSSVVLPVVPTAERPEVRPATEETSDEQPADGATSDRPAFSTPGRGTPSPSAPAIEHSPAFRELGSVALKTPPGESRRDERRDNRSEPSPKSSATSSVPDLATRRGQMATFLYTNPTPPPALPPALPPVDNAFQGITDVTPQLPASPLETSTSEPIAAVAPDSWSGATLVPAAEKPAPDANATPMPAWPDATSPASDAGAQTLDAPMTVTAQPVAPPPAAQDVATRALPPVTPPTESAAAATIVADAAANVISPRTVASMSSSANFAANPREMTPVAAADRKGSNKTFVDAEREGLTPRHKSVGTDVAKPVLPMSARFLPTPFQHPTTEYAVARMSAGTDDVAPAQAEPSAPDTVSTAHQAVEVVLHAVDQVSTREQKSVNLEFSVGENALSVRVELHANEVRTTFHTDSSELRAALSHEWQVVTDGSAGGDRNVRVAPAIFTASDASANAFAGDASSRQRDTSSRNRAERSAVQGVSRTAAFSASSAGAPVSHAPSRQRSHTSRHLHTLA